MYSLVYFLFYFPDKTLITIDTEEIHNMALTQYIRIKIKHIFTVDLGLFL